MSKKSSEHGGSALPGAAEDRLVDGVPVRTYRGTSLAELAPRIRAELGDSAMILRQREGVSGGIGGFFAKRMVEVDVAILQLPGAPHVDVADGPAVGPPQATVPFDALRPPLPTVPFSQVAEHYGLPTVPAGAEPEAPAAAPAAPPPPAALPLPPAPAPLPPTAPTGSFTVGAPTVADAAGLEAALLADQARERAEREAVLPPAAVEPPFEPAPAPPIAPTPAPPAAQPFQPAFEEPAFDAGRAGAEAAPVAQGEASFEDRLRSAGLSSSPSGDPVADLAPLHAALIHRGVPEPIASPVVDDTLVHRVPLQPGRAVAELLASELARRIPTAPLAGRSGQAVAFVGSSGAGKTRAIARLAAAYGAAGRVPVACVTLQDSGGDGLLATALAPFGIAVHAAPDALRALDRITALRRHALVLVDTPGVSPGDTAAVDRLGATLQLLELDQVALCLPVVLAAPIARRVLRAMRPLGPTVIVATHADEADLLGGVVAVAIDRRVPLAYVSAGAGRGSIAGADAHQIAAELVLPVAPHADEPVTRLVPRSARAVQPLDHTSEPLEAPGPAPLATPLAPAQPPRQAGPAVDVAAGAAYIAAPWIVSSPLRDDPRRR